MQIGAVECEAGSTHLHNAAVRLADEGIPIAAICRSLHLTQRETREVLRDAMERGHIVCIPRDDWPIGTRREDRLPDSVPAVVSSEDLVMAVMRTFRTTQSQSILLAALLRRPQMTTEALHTCIKHVNKEDTEIKIVTVMVCHIRKKLQRFGIKIVTIWGRGFYVPAESKKLAVALMQQVLPTAREQLELEEVDDAPPTAPAV